MNGDNARKAQTWFDALALAPLAYRVDEPHHVQQQPHVVQARLEADRERKRLEDERRLSWGS